MEHNEKSISEMIDYAVELVFSPKTDEEREYYEKFLLRLIVG